MKKEKYYTITRICKKDIIQAFDDVEEMTPKIKKYIQTMTDADMKNLASELSDDYCNQLFWDSLRINFEGKFMVKKKC